MRSELLYNPLMLIERLAKSATMRRRMNRLRSTAAAKLRPGHIDSLELLESLVNDDIKVIYDIGANVGTWTLLAKSVLPNAKIHAFEPLREHADSFRDATDALSDITLHEIALGEGQGRADVHVTSFSDASSLLPLTDFGAKQYGLEETERVSVKVDSVDNLIANKRAPLPDLLKLDIQGYELVALRGAQSALRHAKAIIIEASFEAIYQRQCLFHHLVEFLADHQMFLRSFGHGVAAGSELVQADLLFKRLPVPSSQGG